MTSFSRTLLLAIITIHTSSCSTHSKDKELISLLEDQLEKSEGGIRRNTDFVLLALTDKSTDPVTSEKAGIWLPKAEEISRITDSVFTYMEGLKKKGKLSNDAADEIGRRLKEFSSQLLSVDEKIKLEFEHNQFLSICNLNKLPFKKETTQTDFIKNLSAESSTAMLTNIQHNIRQIENKTVTFCNEQVGTTCGLSFHETYSLLVGQNSNIVSPGSEIEITAGVGAFSKVANPHIRINKKKLNLNENGYSSYKFRSSKMPGVYKMPVEISYIDESGQNVNRIVTVEYTVTPPCN